MFEITSELYLFSHENVLKGLALGAQESVGNSPRSRKPTILVVDDQRLVADTTTMVLNQCGFRAECSYGGQSALETALQLKPDYLLSDIVMPGMNGVDLAICVQNQLPATVIVLLSGQAGITDLIRQAKEGGYEFNLLAKPIHPEKLVAYLKQKAPQFWRR